MDRMNWVTRYFCIALLVTLNLLPTDAIAGIHVGNGGDAVVCYTNEQQTELKSVVMLDYFEASHILKNMAPDFGNPPVIGDSYHEYLEVVLSRMRRHNEQLAGMLASYLHEYSQRTEFLDEIELVDVPDSGHIALPYNCKIKQIAIQRLPRFIEEPRFVVDESLFHQLDLMNRAMLAIHEAVYAWAIELGQVNSLNTRYITAYLSSRRPETDSTETFMETFLRAGFKSVTWYDEQNDSLWSLFEKGNELPWDCQKLAGKFRAPSAREFLRIAPTVLASPLGNFLFANAQGHPVEVFTSEYAPEHSTECPGAGRNQLKVLSVSDDSSLTTEIVLRCADKPGPYVLCVER